MSEDRPIRVLVVDDSAVARMLLVHILESDPRIEVVGTLDNGRTAVDYVSRQRPDVLLMDVHMPGFDGFEATREIMQTCPLPIVVCSGLAQSQDGTVFRAMECGAVACVQKPPGPEHPEHAARARDLLQAVTLMASVKVVRRWPHARPRPPEPTDDGRQPPCVVGIGASTGGPPVLQMILMALRRDFPAPILVVQHISAGFLPGLANWLAQTSGLSVQIAAHGAPALPGHVYLAPDDFHLMIGPDGALVLSRAAPENNLRPAVACLFGSLAEHCGPRAIGVLLTGMGKDGARELRLMRDRGALTIAQDRDSAVVFGMPGEAVRLDAATHVLPAEQIAAVLTREAPRRLQARRNDMHHNESESGGKR